MWKKLSATLAVAALAACCPLSAGDSCGSTECHDGKKDAASCQKMMGSCDMQGKKACCPHKKMVKITPVRKVSDSDPGFIAILEEYSVTTDIPVQGQNSQASGAGQTGTSAK